MLGTLSLLILFVLGVLQITPWIIVPFAVLNGFIGLHFPAGKAALARQRGFYWRVYFMSLPLQAVLAAGVFVLGYLFGMLFY